jgi:hypothetical protein
VVYRTREARRSHRLILWSSFAEVLDLPFRFPAGILVPWSEPFPVEVSPDRMGRQGGVEDWKAVENIFPVA